MKPNFEYRAKAFVRSHINMRERLLKMNEGDTTAGMYEKIQILKIKTPERICISPLSAAKYIIDFHGHIDTIIVRKGKKEADLYPSEKILQELVNDAELIIKEAERYKLEKIQIQDSKEDLTPSYLYAARMINRRTIIRTWQEGEALSFVFQSVNKDEDEKPFIFRREKTRNTLQVNLSQEACESIYLILKDIFENERKPKLF